MAKVQRAVKPNVGKKRPEVQDQYFSPEIAVKQLPSGFIPYPSNVQVSYRPFSMGEIKKMGQDNISLTKKYEYVLNGITVINMDKMQLTVADVLYLSMLRKLTIPGVESVTVTKRCTHCGEFIVGHRILLDTVEFEDLKTQLPLSFEFEGVKYSFSPLTIGGLLEISEDTNDEPEDEQLLAKTCISPGYDEALAMARKLNNDLPYNNEDLIILNRIDNMMYHGVAPISIPCKECGLENKVILDEEEKGVLVLPFREDTTPFEARISVGQ